MKADGTVILKKTQKAFRASRRAPLDYSAWDCKSINADSTLQWYSGNLGETLTGGKLFVLCFEGISDPAMEIRAIFRYNNARPI